MAFFPSDFGMGDVGNNGGNNRSNKTGKPEEIVIFNDEVRQNSKKDIVKDGNTNANKKITSSVLAGFDIIC